MDYSHGWRGGRAMQGDVRSEGTLPWGVDEGRDWKMGMGAGGIGDMVAVRRC